MVAPRGVEGRATTIEAPQCLVGKPRSAAATGHVLLRDVTNRQAAARIVAAQATACAFQLHTQQSRRGLGLRRLCIDNKWRKIRHRRWEQTMPTRKHTARPYALKRHFRGCVGHRTVIVN